MACARALVMSGSSTRACARAPSRSASPDDRSFFSGRKDHQIVDLPGSLYLQLHVVFAVVRGRFHIFLLRRLFKLQCRYDSAFFLLDFIDQQLI
jgi:hypothetical protein